VPTLDSEIEVTVNAGMNHGDQRVVRGKVRDKQLHRFWVTFMLTTHLGCQRCE